MCVVCVVGLSMNLQVSTPRIRQVMRPDMTSIRYKIDKLNDKKYTILAVQIKLVLEAKILWRFLESNTDTFQCREDTSEVQEEKMRLHSLKRQCLAEILLNVFPSLCPL